MSLKSDKTISGNTAKEFLENLINFFHANTPELTLLESVSPGDSEYTGYPIYSAGAPVSGNQYICESGLNDFNSPVYFFGTSVDNVVLMITLMGKWLSFSMCHSLTAARKIGDIIDKAKLTKICPLTNIVRGSSEVYSQGSDNIGQQGLQYYTYKVHLDHSTDIYRISLQYINSDYSTCYRFKPLLISSSTPATYYNGEEQFSVIFTRTDKGVACALNLFENLNKNATNGLGSDSYPQGQLLYFSFNEPVEISERLYSKADPWLSTDYIADEDVFMPQWAEFLATFWKTERWTPYQFYQRIGLKHFVPAFADTIGPERARNVDPVSDNAIKLLSPKISRYYAYAAGDVNFRIMPSQFFLLPKMKKGEAFTRQIYVPCSQERGEIYLCYIPAAEESDMPKSGNIYEIGDKKFMCIYPGMCGLFARVG